MARKERVIFLIIIPFLYLINGLVFPEKDSDPPVTPQLPCMGVRQGGGVGRTPPLPRILLKILAKIFNIFAGK